MSVCEPKLASKTLDEQQQDGADPAAAATAHDDDDDGLIDMLAISSMMPAQTNGIARLLNGGDHVADDHCPEAAGSSSLTS